MTLLVRDEVDVVDANILYHLNVGVDLIIATDNNSRDGTAELLESYARDGHVRLLREHGEDMRQGEWVTRMARLAATELGADWILNADADEFWWCRVGPLRDVLARIPQRFGTARAFLRNFVPREGDDQGFADRMTVRLVPSELPVSSRFRRHPFHAQDKVLHRAHRQVRVGEGNHEARWPGSIDLRGWWPFEVLHFPVRSAEQAATKWRNWARHGYSGYDELLVGSPRAYYESLVLEDATLAEGLAAGWLAVDTRLRDVLLDLRASRAAGRPLVAPAVGSRPLELPAPTLAEEGAFAGDVAAGTVGDSLHRATVRTEALEARLGLLETSPVAALDRPLARIRRALGEERRP